MAGATITVLVILGYLGAASFTSAESSYLGSGRRYSWDDLNKISRALERQRTPYRIDDQRRVSVSRDQLEQAETAIAKLELGPRLPGEIRDQAAAPNLWESPHDKEIREHRDQEKILESMISGLPGIVGAFVRLDRPKSRWGLQPAVKPSAFVCLDSEGDRQLPFQTVQSITTILRGYEPGLSVDAVTVVDRRGHKYLDAGNPALSVLSHNRAREEELSQEILEQLDWIKGVRVSVQLPDSLTTDSKTPASRVEAARPEHAGTQARGTSSRPESGGPEANSPKIAINRPLGVAEPAVTAPAPAAKALVHENPAEGGRIWVKVPRSYYYQVSILPSHKEPSLEELQKLVIRTEEQIKTGLALVVPLSGPGCWKATVDVIPDEVPLNQPSVLSSRTDSRRLTLDWGIAVAMAATAAALVLLGSWISSARRPAGRPGTSLRGLRYHTGSALVPGPSERVREFVRRNPDSAVSVLARWTSLGGDVP
jgi:hypothetical protein